MPKVSHNKAVYRIIDANINRLKEGLRVSEEITRFILDDSRATGGLKRIRHRVDLLAKGLSRGRDLLRERESSKDVGRTIFVGELKRRNYQDIFFANIQRAKESLRVLEEFSKLLNKKSALGFKGLRYGIYHLEKEVSKKNPALYHRR
ncbi:MAG: hypothetical protein A3K54_04835 [Omnitrophica WOR_2 bacterium RBG_13_44_8]|nr:MAG: hypothetical protein A3K54_04835 [Omnitrophica WOR_2 bacterium RBG_13_44_8]